MSEVVQLNLRLLDRDIKIACPANEQDELQQAARFLDQRLRTIRDHAKVVGVERIALMAALDLAHELQQAQKAEGAQRDSSERIARMQTKLQAALLADRQLELG